MHSRCEVPRYEGDESTGADSLLGPERRAAAARRRSAGVTAESGVERRPHQRDVLLSPDTCLQSALATHACCELMVLAWIGRRADVPGLSTLERTYRIRVSLRWGANGAPQGSGTEATAF